MKKFMFSDKVSGVSKFILLIIFVNAIVITLSEFPRVANGNEYLIIWLEIACVLIFIIEAISKIIRFGWHNYICVLWNKMDLAVIVLSLPIFIMPLEEVNNVGIIMILRLVRFVRLLRILTIVPSGGRFVNGLKRALKATFGVAIGMLLLLFISSIVSTMIFRDHAPDMFGNPILSAYSMFRVFAITGWFEIPRKLIAMSYYDTPGWILFIRVYFIGFLLSGGMIGLSIFNATFIDALVEDNTEEIEDKIGELEKMLVGINEKLDKIDIKIK